MFFKKIFKKEKEEATPLTACNILIVKDRFRSWNLFLQTFNNPIRSENIIYQDSNIEFRWKEFKLSSDKTVILHVWDATVENFEEVPPQYFNGVHGIILGYNMDSSTSFDHLKSAVEKSIERLSSLKIPIHIVGILGKKKDKVEVPEKDVAVLAKKIGAKFSMCCLEDMKSTDEIFKDLVTDITKKINVVFNPSSAGASGDSPSPSTESDESQKISPASLISLIKCEGMKKEVERNETGLFGNYIDGLGFLSYNVSVLGCPKIGKSCLCARCIQNEIAGSRKGDNLWICTYNLLYGKYLRLRMTEGEFPKAESDDAAGYTKAHAILLCYDITSRSSFDALKEAVRVVKEHAMAGAVVMVVGLRYDDKKHVAVGGSEGQFFADENGLIFRECSAMDNAGVSYLFSKILLELQNIDGFALPIRVECANYALPPSVSRGNGRKDGEGGEDSSLLDKILPKETIVEKGHDCEYDYFFKINIVGDSGSGKTSLILRYADDTYTDTNKHDCSVGTKRRTIELSNGKIVKLIVWDTKPRELVDTHHYFPYRGTKAIIICYDQTKPEPFDSIRYWKDELRYAPEDAFIMVVRTKSDLPSCPENPDGARKLADALGVSYAECSAKTGAGVIDVFEKAIIGIGRNMDCKDLDFDIGPDGNASITKT